MTEEISPKIQVYIQDQLKRSVSKEEIERNLINEGWPEEMVSHAIESISDKSTHNQSSVNTADDKKAKIGLILGIVGLITWLFPLVGGIVSAIGLAKSIAGTKSVNKKSMATVGVVLCSLGLLLTIVNASIGAYMGATGQHSLVNKINNVENSQNVSDDDAIKDKKQVVSKKEKVINQGVEEIKKTMSLPMKLDDYTTFVDVIALPNSILYHYEVSEEGSEGINSDLLKKELVQKLCLSNDTRSLLEMDIGMDYLYSVKNSDLEFLISVVLSDCT